MGCHALFLMHTAPGEGQGRTNHGVKAGGSQVSQTNTASVIELLLTCG